MFLKANHVLTKATETTVIKKAHRTAEATQLVSHINRHPQQLLETTIITPLHLGEKKP